MLTCEVLTPVSPDGVRNQYFVMAPRDFTTTCTRLCVEGISDSADGYRCATRRTLLLKSANVSAFFSSRLNARSTQLHTYSCGLRSGEHFGQPGIASIPNSANASVAWLVWSRGSLSRRMRMRALSGKLGRHSASLGHNLCHIYSRVPRESSASGRDTNSRVLAQFRAMGPGFSSRVLSESPRERSPIPLQKYTRRWIPPIPATRES